MNDKDFKKGMTIINLYYDKFSFPTSPSGTMDKMKYDVWKNALDVISNFSYVVDYYCKTEKFAPMSPRSLLEVYENMVKVAKDIPSSESAWELVKRSLNRHGINGYFNSYEQYVNRFYQSLGDVNIKKACKDIESKLKDLTSDNSSYVYHEFKQVYERYVELENKEDTLKIDSKKVLEIE